MFDLPMKLTVLIAVQSCPPTSWPFPPEPLTLCSKAMFSRTRTIITPSQKDTLNDLSTANIRKLTEKLIPDLPPDDSGKRIGFFDHVFYAALGIGLLVVIGIGCGSYFMYRAASN